MNIVLFTTSLEQSAVTTQLLMFAKYLYQKKHKVMVVCHEYLSYKTQQECSSLPFTVTSLFCHKWQIYKGIRMFKSLQRQFKIDIVHCHLGRAYIIGVLSKQKHIKLLATFHNLKNYLAPLTRLFISLFYKKLNGITAVSHTALDSYHFNQSMYSTCPVRSIYNPVFITQEEGDNTLITPQYFDNKFFSIGIINRFVEGKGYDRWFELVKKMSLQNKIQFQEKTVQVNFWTAGSGELEQKFKDKVIQEKISHVSFLGHRQDIFKLIKKSQLIVYPTINEGFGLVLYEALLLGVPILINPLAVFKELLGENSLWFVDFSNVSIVKEKIHYFVQNYTDIKQQAVQEGQRFRNMLNPEKIFKQYITFYEDCCIS